MLYVIITLGLAIGFILVTLAAWSNASEGGMWSEWRYVAENSRVLRAKLYGHVLTVVYNRFDQNTPQQLLQNQLAYNFPAYSHIADGLILDAGGYIGVTAMVLAKVLPEARILSFEPLWQNRFYFALNIAANELSHRVEVRREGCGYCNPRCAVDA